MAIWQFNLYLIPAQSLVKHYGEIPVQLDFDDALDTDWWTELNATTSDFNLLFLAFGEIQEWTKNSEGLRCYGNAETNDLSVSFDSETNRIEGLHCRFDIRQMDKSIVNEVLSFAAKFDCLLMDVNGKLFKPTITAFVDALQKSGANRFIADPRQFLIDLSGE